MFTSALPETTLVSTLRARFPRVMWLRTDHGHRAVTRVADAASEAAQQTYAGTEFQAIWTGSRAWVHEDGASVAPILQAVLLGLARAVGGPRNLRVIQGEAVGLDLLVRGLAGEVGACGSGFPVLSEEYRLWGPGVAPRKRNERMVYGLPLRQLCIGVPHPTAPSRGTFHCMGVARQHGMAVYCVTFPDMLAINAQFLSWSREDCAGD